MRLCALAKAVWAPSEVACTCMSTVMSCELACMCTACHASSCCPQGALSGACAPCEVVCACRGSLGALASRTHTNKQRGCRTSSHALARPATRSHGSRELPRQQLGRPMTCVHTRHLLCDLMLALSCSSSSVGAVRCRMHMHEQCGCHGSSHACARPAMHPRVGRERPLQQRERLVSLCALSHAAWAPYEVGSIRTSCVDAV